MTKSILTALIFLSSMGIATSMRAQTISTVAGTGVAGFSGDDSASTMAKINAPYDVTADALGNIYISDASNNRLRKISSTGIITTICGTGATYIAGDGGPATAANIQTPRSICLDPSGNIIFSDYGNNRIRRINVATGIITTLAGSATHGFGGDGGPSTAATLNEAWGVACDTNGNIYLADQLNNRIRKIDLSGNISTICGTGASGSSGDGGPASTAKLQYPAGIACDRFGNIFIADKGNCTIRKINASGIITRYAGLAPGFTTCGFTGDGAAASNAKLDQPAGIAVDDGGNLYITDYNNSRVRKVNTSGIITTIAGNGSFAFSGDGGPATAAALNYPTGVVAVTSIGKVYISDNSNNRIRAINYLHAPYFDGGHSQYLTVCENSGAHDISGWLNVDDISIGRSEVWSIIGGPNHGTASVTYSVTSTGSTLYPSGCNYTPATGYSGHDTIKISVNNGTYADTTTMYVNVLPFLHASVIAGIDSVCPNHTDTLSDSTSGGTWVSTDTAVAKVSASGVVTGRRPGLDTIVYTVSNICDTSVAYFYIKVSSYTICHTGVEDLYSITNTNGIKLSQNPNRGTFSVVVTTGRNHPVRLNISNLLGQRVKSYTLTPGDPLEISSGLKTGNYILSASDGIENWTERMMITE